MSKEDFKAAKQPETPPRRHPKKVAIPKRTPSIVVPPKRRVFITPDKTTCVECPCFPKEDPYDRHKKLNPCQKSPVTLYELAAGVVDRLNFPAAFNWLEDDVARWMEEDVGLPQYKECIFDNYINGMRLLMLEDPSNLAQLNIRDFEHMKIITANVCRLFSVEFVRFARSVGLPPRKPLTHCTWFKSRTGPSWGIRKNWTRCDIMRWMKILMPAPVRMDHWDLVWYQKPDFPKVKFARIPNRSILDVQHIPRYKPPPEDPESHREYMTPRKFRILKDIPDARQYIWISKPMVIVREEAEKQMEEERKKMKKKKPLTVPKDTGLVPKKISLTGLRGKEFILARRKMAKPKFLPSKKHCNS